MFYILFIPLKPFSDPSCPVDGGTEITPIRIEMTYQIIKVIKVKEYNRSTRPPHYRGQAFRGAMFSWCTLHIHSPTYREYIKG